MTKTGTHLLVALLSCAACSTSAGGPPIHHMGVRVTSDDGMGTLVDCTQLPVLLGSRVQKDIDVDGRFRIVVFASHQNVDVTLDGASFSDTAVHSVDLDQLCSGYREELDVTASNGGAFTLELSSGCSQVMDANDAN